MLQLVVSWPGAGGGQSEGTCTGGIAWPALDSIVLLGTAAGANGITMQVRSPRGHAEAAEALGLEAANFVMEKHATAFLLPNIRDSGCAEAPIPSAAQWQMPQHQAHMLKEMSHPLMYHKSSSQKGMS